MIDFKYKYLKYKKKYLDLMNEGGAKNKGKKADKAKKIRTAKLKLKKKL